LWSKSTAKFAEAERRHLEQVTGDWSLVTGHWSLVTGHWSLITGARKGIVLAVVIVVSSFSLCINYVYVG
jgi:hypothetical protein